MKPQDTRPDILLLVTDTTTIEGARRFRDRAVALSGRCKKRKRVMGRAL